ncbi:Protein YLS [Trema orientale]|uniref:Protein YLS n=1 Tax=Trema orientale TaxID=63057 RepID=A0A2P5FI02_TREOI|nr:Protein YLS [Trema orientale]
MADDLEKTAHADGATVEPPHHVAPRRRRGGYRFSQGCECCCGLGCLRVLVVIIAAAIVLTGLTIAIFCIVINPHELKFHVTDTSLTTNKTLGFKLLLNVTVRNPNKRIGIHIEFSPDYYAYYGGESLGGGIGQLGWGLSYLPPRAGSAAHEKGWLLFEGRRTVSFGSRAVKRLNKRKSDGVSRLLLRSG